MTTAEAQAHEIVAQQLTVDHESAHAAAALVLGIEMSEVCVDRPTPTTKGRTTIHGSGAFPREAALIILTGPLSDRGKPDPRWPLSDDDEATQDECQLKALVDQLGYGRPEWDQLVSDAWKLITNPDFALAESVFASLLEQHGRIDGELLKTIVHCVDHHANQGGPVGAQDTCCHRRRRRPGTRRVRGAGQRMGR